MVNKYTGYTDAQLKQLEKAVTFMVKEVNRYCRNSKPVIIHSIKVGVKLIKYGVPSEVVMAGFLHDLIEDTRSSLKKIERAFGSKVAAYVSAMTLNYTYTDYKLRWDDGMKRLIQLGKYALLLKLVDSADNLPYYSRIMERKKMKVILWKARLVLKSCKKDWGHLLHYQEFSNLYKNILKSFKISDEAEYFRD